MKLSRIPTTIVLLVLSWVIAILGLAVGGYLIILRFNEINSLISGFLILLGGLLLAAIIRMFGNIGQMFFDLKNFIFNDLRASIERFTGLTQSISDDLQTLIQKLTTLTQDTKETKEVLTKDFLTLNQDLKAQLQNQTANLTQILQELTCDSKDMNQNIYQIKTFFEQIERHLHLKK